MHESTRRDLLPSASVVRRVLESLSGPLFCAAFQHRWVEPLGIVSAECARARWACASRWVHSEVRLGVLGTAEHGVAVGPARVCALRTCLVQATEGAEAVERARSGTLCGPQKMIFGRHRMSRRERGPFLLFFELHTGWRRPLIICFACVALFARSDLQELCKLQCDRRVGMWVLEHITDGGCVKWTSRMAYKDVRRALSIMSLFRAWTNGGARVVWPGDHESMPSSPRLPDRANDYRGACGEPSALLSPSIGRRPPGKHAEAGHEAPRSSARTPYLTRNARAGWHDFLLVGPASLALPKGATTQWGWGRYCIERWLGRDLCAALHRSLHGFLTSTRRDGALLTVALTQPSLALSNTRCV